MDIKIALGKIEQYWQIIRNLHFHIEQEGKISPEEYALIEKYLKVISLKYNELIEDTEQLTDSAVSETPKEQAAAIPSIYQIKEKESKPVTEDKKSESSVDFAPVEILPLTKHIVDESPVEKEEELVQTSEQDVEPERVQIEPTLPPQVLEKIAPEIVVESPRSKSISSYLEHMLESPDNVPDKPLLFTNEKMEKKAPSLNDRLKEMRSPVEDLNSRIKKATAEKISLNDKFEFIRELFGNNPVEYATAIQYFDNYGTYAWEKVENEFSTRFNWPKKPGTVEKLKALVNGK